MITTLFSKNQTKMQNMVQKIKYTLTASIEIRKVSKQPGVLTQCQDGKISSTIFGKTIWERL